MQPTATDRPGFEAHRTRLFGIAYRMLGSVHDAEDVVQDAFVRWQQAEPAALRSPEAWLVAVTTRLAIDRLRRATTERQAYVGEWLPEPLAIAGGGASSDGESTGRLSELASDLSVAFLVLLERLGPEERAAFLLREVFERAYDEIGGIIGRTPTSARQMVHRARERVRGEGRRFPVDPRAHEQLLTRFVAAIRADDEAALLELLAPQARLVSDSGGKVRAARKTLMGAPRIARFLRGLQRKHGRSTEHRLGWVNGEPALVTIWDGRVYATTSVEVQDGRVVALFRVLNPDKLRAAPASWAVPANDPVPRT